MCVHFETYLYFQSCVSWSVIKPHGLNRPNLFPAGAGFHIPISRVVSMGRCNTCSKPSFRWL